MQECSFNKKIFFISSAYAILEACVIPVLDVCDPEIEEDSTVIDVYITKLTKLNESLICVDLPTVEVIQL